MLTSVPAVPVNNCQCCLFGSGEALDKRIVLGVIQGIQAVFYVIKNKTESEILKILGSSSLCGAWIDLVTSGISQCMVSLVRVTPGCTS